MSQMYVWMQGDDDNNGEWMMRRTKCERNEQMGMNTTMKRQATMKGKKKVTALG